jgi:hypothetical protein
MLYYKFFTRRVEHMKEIWRILPKDFRQTFLEWANENLDYVEPEPELLPQTPSAYRIAEARGISPIEYIKNLRLKHGIDLKEAVAMFETEFSE